jgi:hypothetical protein
MTKKECLEQGYYSEEYFFYSNDGWIYDRETGENVAKYDGIEGYNSEYFIRELGKEWASD